MTKGEAAAVLALVARRHVHRLGDAVEAACAALGI